MKLWQALLTVSCAVATAIAPAFAHAEVASETSIRELFAVSGHEESMKLSIGAILPALKQMAKDVPEEQLRQLMDSERMMTSIVATYRKYFTEEEVREMATFYKTPTGAKLGKLNTKIQGEAADRHLQSWRMSLINEQIQKGNFKIQQPEQGR
jgi:hypothetical protein